MIGFKNSPECGRIECFANEDKLCMILSKNDFNKECPFFKTREQVEIEKAECNRIYLDKLADIRKGE